MATVKKIAAKAYDFSFKAETYVAKAGAEVEVPQELFDRLQGEGLWREPPAVKPSAEPKAVEPTLVKAGFGKFNVLGTDGKAVNEKPLAKEDAEKLLAEVVEKAAKAAASAA